MAGFAGGMNTAMGPMMPWNGSTMGSAKGDSGSVVSTATFAELRPGTANGGKLLEASWRA